MIKKKLKQVGSWVSRRRFPLICLLIVALLLSSVSVEVAERGQQSIGINLGDGEELVITLGSTALAAGVVDYVYDGVADDVQWQAALNALPATGGRLINVSTVQLNFSATVTRAIDNVIIEGAGRGSYFTNDGGTALFTAGGNNWIFQDLRTDAGGLNFGITTGWELRNVTIAANYYAYRTPVASTTGADWQIPVGRAATFVVASVGASAQSIAQADYVCDGVDDDVEIQAAIDALPANGGKVVLLEGTFNISSTILISKETVFIEGMGAGDLAAAADSGTTIFLANNSDCDVIANLNATQRVLYLHNFTIDGNKTNQASGHGININNLQVGGHYKHGIFNLNIYYCKQHGIFSNVIAANCGIHGSGLYVAGCDGAGMYLTNGAQGSHIKTPNWFVSNGAEGVYIGGGSDCILELYCENNGTVGAELHNTNSIVTVWSGGNQTVGVFAVGLNSSIVHVNTYNNNLSEGSHAELACQNCTNSAFTGKLETNLALANRDALAVSGSMDGCVFRGRLSGKNRAIYAPNLTGTMSITECSLHSDGDIFACYIAGAWRNEPFPGMIYYRRHTEVFMDVLAVSATHVRTNEDLSAGVPITFTIDAQPDVPRTLSGHFDAHVNITAYTMDILGRDGKGDTITEALTEADGWDWETSNAFATITSITMSARTGTGVGDTMDVGITDVLGLSNETYADADVYKIKKNNADAVVAGAQYDPAYETYDMAVIGLGAADDFTFWFRSNLNVVD